MDIYGRLDVDSFDVDLFTTEIIDKGLERQFEEYMRTSKFTHDDIRFINRIKELIQQRNIEIFEQKIQDKQKELELLQVESATSIA